MRTADAIMKKKETFNKIGHQQGNKNSQFGKCWITNGTANKMIHKNNPVPEGWRKGRVT